MKYIDIKYINMKYENWSFGGCSTEGWIKICQKRLGPSVDNIAKDTILTILRYWKRHNLDNVAILQKTQS